MPSDDFKLITGSQLRAARALVRWSAEDLAERSRVAVATITHAEAEDGPVSVRVADAHRKEAGQHESTGCGRNSVIGTKSRLLATLCGKGAAPKGGLSQGGNAQGGLQHRSTTHDDAPHNL